MKSDKCSINTFGTNGLSDFCVVPRMPVAAGNRADGSGTATECHLISRRGDPDVEPGAAFLL